MLLKQYENNKEKIYKKYCFHIPPALELYKMGVMITFLHQGTASLVCVTLHIIKRLNRQIDNS